MSRRKSRNLSAFTLIELLVVITIIGILLALLLVGIQKVRAAAGRAECASKLRQLGLALHGYHDTNGIFPVQGFNVPGPTGLLDDDLWENTWMFKILPYLEKDALHRQGIPPDRNRAFGPLSPEGQRYYKTWGTPVPAYLCPSDPRPLGELKTPVVGIPGLDFALNSYQGVSGRNSLEMQAKHAEDLNDGSDLTGIIVGPNVSVKMSQVTRGLSYTLMVGERPPGPTKTGGVTGAWAYGFWQSSLWAVGNIRLISYAGGQWTREDLDACPEAAYFSPGDINSCCHLGHFWSFHSGGGNWLLADGSVQFMTYDAGETLIVEMSSIK